MLKSMEIRSGHSEMSVISQVYIYAIEGWVPLRLITRANVIPIAVTIFTVFIVSGVPSDASQCTINNIEILSQLIDERINATH